jgi:glutamate-5-semialdehyde dehydrogenase
MTDDRTEIQRAAAESQAASHILASVPGSQRTDAILRIADGLREHASDILAANEEDLAAGREKGLTDAFIDRLALSEDRIEEMAQAVEAIASQSDPIGSVEAEWIRPNGLRVGKERIPLGVVAVIYEARPNVTSDAAALALRSGNAIILKGGSDASNSNRVIGEIVIRAVEAAGLHPASVQVLTDVSREGIAELLTYDEYIDVVIPRGGEGLIRYVAEHSRIPVLKHYKGVCHVYVERAADQEMAKNIVINGKVQRPSVCNAVETLLVHADVADEFLHTLFAQLDADNVQIHGCERTRQILGDEVGPASEEDWHAEYLSLDLAVRVVDSLDEAVDHIQQYGSDHTDAIVTDSVEAAQRFRSRVQSGCVMVNASTRFADGGQLGLGAEIGISTSRLHAYGPMGVEGLTTTHFVVTGNGQIRE